MVQYRTVKKRRRNRRCRRKPVCPTKFILAYIIERKLFNLNLFLGSVYGDMSIFNAGHWGELRNHT